MVSNAFGPKSWTTSPKSWEMRRHLRTLTKDEKHKFITQTNRAEKWATFAILSFILIVAAFNIMASLTVVA